MPIIFRLAGQKSRQHEAAETAFQQDGRENQKCAGVERVVQVREVFQLVQPGGQRRADELHIFQTGRSQCSAYQFQGPQRQQLDKEPRPLYQQSGKLHHLAESILR